MRLVRLSFLLLALGGCAHASGSASHAASTVAEAVALPPRLDRMVAWAPRTTPQLMSLDLERIRALPGGDALVRRLAEDDDAAVELYARTRYAIYGIGASADDPSVEVAAAILDPSEPPAALVDELAAAPADAGGFRRMATETFGLVLTPEGFLLVVPRALSGDADVLPERRTVPEGPALETLRTILASPSGAPIASFVITPAPNARPLSYVLRERDEGVVIELVMPLADEDASTWDDLRKRQFAEGMLEGLRRIDARALLLERYQDRVAIQPIPRGVIGRLGLSREELGQTLESAEDFATSLEGRLAVALPDASHGNASGDPRPALALRALLGDGGPEALPTSRVGLEAAVQIAIAERALGFVDEALAFARRGEALAASLEGEGGALGVGPALLEGMLIDELGRHEEAARRLRGIAAVCAAHPTCRDRSIAERAAALALAGAGDVHALDALPLPTLGPGDLGDAAAVRALDDRARALHLLHRDDEALPIARQASAIAARLDPEGTSRARASVDRTYGIVALSADRVAESLTVLESTYARLGRDAALTAFELGLELCRARTRAERHEDALAICTSTVRLADRDHGPWHRALAHHRLGEAEAAAGRREAARSEAETALGLVRGLETVPLEKVAEIEAFLASLAHAPSHGRRGR